MTARILFCAAVATVSCAVSHAAEVPFRDVLMPLPANPVWASDLRASEKIELSDGRRLVLHLFVGSVMDFVGPTSFVDTGRQLLSVDAMIMSTNKDLDFDAVNPTIQRTFRRQLSNFENVQEEIRKTFKSVRVTEPYEEAVVASCPAGFSPRAVGFVVTDRSVDGTWNDPKWQTNILGEDLMGKRIRDALDKLRPLGIKTIVTPLVGVSKVDFPTGKDPFIKDGEKRTLLLQRMARSMKGILSGVEGHVTGQKGAPSLEEFAIVVYSGDMRNLVSGKELESSTLRKSPIGEYQTVKGVLMGTFSEGADGIRKKLER